MRISDWSSDVCSSDLPAVALAGAAARPLQRAVSWHPPASLRLQRSGRHLRPGDRPLHPLRPRELGRLLVAALERPRALSGRSEEHTSELQSLMRISYAVFCLKKKT